MPFIIRYKYQNVLASRAYTNNLPLALEPIRHTPYAHWSSMAIMLLLRKRLCQWVSYIVKCRYFTYFHISSIYYLSNEVITVASCEKINRRAKNKTHTEPPLRVIYPKIGKGNAQRNLERKWSCDQRERVRESITQGEGISTPHVRRTRRDPRSKIKKRLLNITHTGNAGGVRRRELDRTSHPMPTYLVWNENQSCRSSAHARRNKTHTNTGKHGTRTPIAGLTSASEPNKPTLETRCHLMDLYRTPSTQQEDTECQWLGLHPSTTHTRRTSNKLLRSRELEPSNCQANWCVFFASVRITSK